MMTIPTKLRLYNQLRTRSRLVRLINLNQVNTFKHPYSVMKINYWYLLKIVSLVLFVTVFASSSSNSQIILSEVMFDPAGDDYYNEFIELCNISHTETIDLAGWQISDSSDLDYIISYEQGTQLKPQQYAIIIDPGYFENSQQYENLIHPEALILTIDDGSFGSQGLSNSIPEPIILISSAGDTVVNYRYTLNNQPGFSDEKRNLSGDDSPQNWANSRVFNGTPGFENSVKQKDYDISLEIVGFPPEALPGHSITLIASIANIGLHYASNLEIAFFEDSNLDSILMLDEQIGTPIIISDSLRPGESHQVRTVIDSLPSGPHFLYGKVYFPLDQDTLNNLASAVVTIGFQALIIIINEIMYRPSAGQAEWIELYNPGKESINFQYWQLSDAHTDKRINLSNTALFVPGKSYLILAEDSTIYQTYPNIPCDVIFPSQGLPALNNSGDRIILYDLIGTLIDQVEYEPGWGNTPGVSLERKFWDHESNDPTNWTLSQNSQGGTPGYKNSISQKDYDLCLKLSIRVNDPDSITILATILNIGLLLAAQFQCDFYIDYNTDSLAQASELAFSIVYQPPSLLPADSVTICQNIPIFNRGFNQMIAALTYELDENQSNNCIVTQFLVPFKPGQLVINEIMFRPLADNTEWIELFNPGSDSLNLFAWKFSDANIDQKHVVTSQNFWIAPKQYVLFAESEEIFVELPNSLFNIVIIPPSWPALNNTSDQIILYDLTEKTIDSMTYLSPWSPATGVSLERIDYLNSSTDSSNWSASIDTTGSTPGRINSVSPVNFDLAVTGINFDPNNPFPEEDITIDVGVTNVGRYAISEFQLSGFIDLNQDNSFQNHEKIGVPFSISQILESGEKIAVSIPYTPLQSGCFSVCATVFSDKDLKTSNNSHLVNLSVGFKKHSLVINEIMYSPGFEQSEWIELYNPQQTTVDIQKWSFSDSDSNKREIIAENHFTIAPQTFLILTADSSILDFYELNNCPLLAIKKWPVLNDDLDKIFLFDASKNIIDEISYLSRWGGSHGVSLERINPNLASGDSSNWSSCVLIPQGGTPGRKNSIYVEVLPSEAELSISPNPFSPDGDGRDDVTIINYQLPFNLSQIHVKIFDIRGRQVRFLVNNQPSGTNRSIIWDGQDDQGHICRMGIYIVYLEAIHYQRGVVKSLKKSVVLAKQL